MGDRWNEESEHAKKASVANGREKRASWPGVENEHGEHARQEKRKEKMVGSMYDRM